MAELSWKDELAKLRRLKELEAKFSRTPSETLQTPQEPPEPTTGERFVGAAEASLSLGTSMGSGLLTFPIAGLKAGADAISRAASGLDEPAKNARQIVEETTSPFVFKPRTPAGIEALNTISVPFQKLEEAAMSAGSAVQDLQARTHKKNTDLLDLVGIPKEDQPEAPTPLIPALVKGGIEFLPSVLGVRRGRPVTLNQRRNDVNRATRNAEAAGVDIGESFETQLTQIEAAADRRTGGSIEPSAGMDEVASGVSARRGQESARVGQMFNEAREGEGQLASRDTNVLATNTRAALSDFDIGEMKSVQARLDEIAGLSDRSRSSLGESLGQRNTAKIDVNDVFEIREKINRNAPSDRQSPEFAANMRIKAELDNFLNDSFADALANPGANKSVSQWRKAIENWSDFKETFDENRIIRRLHETEATPEQVRQWILGANAVGASRQAGLVVSKLKTILGENSPEFNTLRQSAMVDVMLPLFDETPNLNKFIKNYDNFKRRNPTLANELFGESGLRELDNFRNTVEAIQKTEPASSVLARMIPERMASVFLVGHDIARRGALVRGLTSAFSLLKKGVGDSRKNQILSELLGYDPSAPLIPKGPIAVGAVTQDLMNQDEQ